MRAHGSEDEVDDERRRLEIGEYDERCCAAESCGAGDIGASSAEYSVDE